MSDGEKKKIQEALKAELKPLLVGLRNDFADFAKLLERILEKEPPEIQKTEVINTLIPPEVQKVEVGNFPEPIKEVSITNPQKEVEVKGLKGFVGQVIHSFDHFNQLGKMVSKGFDTLKINVFRVKVENQKEVKFPDVQKVQLQLTKELIAILKQAVVQRVKIENSTPSEAIPVVLTNAERRRFYDILQQVTGGVNLGNVKDLLKQIETNTGLFTGLSDVANATNEAVTVNTSNTLVLAANSDRADADFVNDGNTIIYIRRGTGAAVVGEGIRLNPRGGSYEINRNNLFKGQIRAIGTAAGGKLSVTEGSSA